MPDGAGRRIGIVGKQIAPPQFHRVHADLRRGEIDQAFGHGRRDRMADGAVLAHHVLVLEHDAGAGAVVRAGVGPADQVDHLVGLDAAGARIDRIGTDPGQVVDLEGGDGAVALDADLRLDAMVARVNVGDKALEAVGDEFDRPPEQFRQRDRRHFVGVDVHLDAERAADVLGEHAHLMRFQIKMLGENVLRHVRRLGAVIDGQALLARIPVGDNGARLVGDAGVAAEDESRFGDRVGFGKAFVRIAGSERALEGEIVAKLGMNHRRRLVERGFRVGYRRQRLIVHVNKRARIFCFGAGAGDDRAHRLALPAGAVDGDGVLRRRFDALEVRQHADPRRDHLGKLGAGNDGDHAGRFFGFRGVDIFDAGVRVRRAQKCDVHHARQGDVADVLAAALRQPRQVGPRHRAADIGVRPVKRGEARNNVVDDFHDRATIRSSPRKRGPRSRPR